MMPWKTTGGCLNSPAPVRKAEVLMALQKTTSRFPTLSSEECYGFSFPTRPHQRCSDNGTKYTKYNDVKYMAVEVTFTLSFGRSHTRRTCILRSVSAVLCISPEKNWDVNRKMKGWGLGEWPVLLPHDGEGEDDLSDE